MAKSLITVINPEEAETVAKSDADIIDIKDPEEGSLGCASTETIEAIMRTLSEEKEVSIALGDMPQLPGTAMMAVKGALQFNPDYIKIGLKGSKNEEQAEEILHKAQKVVDNSGKSCTLVAAAYADHEKADTVSPMETIEAASNTGLTHVMIDTLSKDGFNLFKFKELEELEQIIQKSAEKNLEMALAGSIEAKHVDDLKELGAEIIGVRGALCPDERSGEIIEGKVENFVSKFN